MPYVRVRYLKRHVVRRGGRRWTYFTHRRTGERLGSDFDQAVKRCLEINVDLTKRERSGGHTAGSFGDLIATYKDAPEFKRLAPRTRRDYAGFLDYIGESFGDLPVFQADREFVIGLRDLWAHKPRRADYLVAVLSALFSFGLDRPKRFRLQINPAYRVGHVWEPEGYRPWPDALIAAWQEHAYAELRWVMELALWTGQRGGDLVGMLWSHYDGEGIEVAQLKTKRRLWIPAAPQLKAVLSDIPRRQTTVLTRRDHQPWKLSHLRHEIAGLNEQLGFKGYSLHGLRKSAAVRLAEAGCSAHQIAAITGHGSLQMVEGYTREVEQKALARSAVVRLSAAQERTTRSQKSDNSSTDNGSSH